MPIEKGTSSDFDLAPSVVEDPTNNWENYFEVNCVQYIKRGHAPKVQAGESNN